MRFPLRVYETDASLARARLTQQQVGVNVHDFWVRRPGKETLKFDFKIFDDSILCPMVRPLASRPRCACPALPCADTRR